VESFPVPGSGPVAVAAPAPAAGPGRWAGSSSAGLDEDGTCVVAYRIRVVSEGEARVVVARSDDGERLTTVATLDKDRFGAMSLERPSLVRTEAGRWRLYVCCATPGSKHWWIDLLEADDPEALAEAIENLLLDPDRARAMGAHGREVVQERFSVARMAEGVTRVLEGIVRQRDAVRV
jgi:hypothetical protein